MDFGLDFGLDLAGFELAFDSGLISGGVGLISDGVWLDFALSFACARIFVHSSFLPGAQSSLGSPRMS